MQLKFPLISGSLKKKLWSIIVLVVGYLVYISLGDLIPQYWKWIGFRTFERSIITLGFVIILLISLSGLALSEKLTTMAIKDGLTGLYNQPYIKARLQEEIFRSERYHYPLSLMMIDLDGFKNVNDQYGNLIGDRILREFSDYIREMIRASDVPARYGGEEFLIILPQTECLDAASVAERIRKEIAQYPFRIGMPREKTCHFTVSIGVYSTPYYGQNVDEVISLADAALYRAKKEGKNKVIVFVK
ncbi:MAG: GGDEF domain-containing protein [Candidatus Aminicenantales bacterium]